MTPIRTSQNLCNTCGGEDPNCDWCKGTGDEIRGALELMAKLAATPGDQGARCPGPRRAPTLGDPA